MANILEILVRLKDEASSKFKNLGKTSKQAGVDLKDFARAAGLVSAGVAAVGVALDQTVGTAVKYAKTVRELSQATGMSAEETSRLIQVADDWGIEIGQVRTALGMMTKNGVQPSIDSLANLADEFVNTEDKTAFAEKAASLFGRQWQTMIPVLAKGGKALREQAAAIDENLIVTEKQIDAARKLEVATDDLTDAYEGFKIVAGNELIPILTGDLEGITRLIGYMQSDGVSGIGKFLTENQKVNDALQDLGFNSIQAFQSVSTKMPGYVRGLEEYRQAVEDVGEAVAGIPEVFDMAMSKISEFNIPADKMQELEDKIALATGKVTEEQLAARDAIGFMAAQLELGNITVDQMYEALRDLESGAASARDIIQRLGASINALKDKTVTVTVRTRTTSGGVVKISEPGPAAPLPPGPPDPTPSPGGPGFGTAKVSSAGGASGIYVANLNI